MSRAEGLRGVGEQLIPAVAYGDAHGLPVETKSAAEIERRYDSIDHLIPPTDNPYYPGNFPAGTTSDDTQLSVGVAEALLAADGFDIRAQASEHLRIYQATPKVVNFKGKLAVRGWGGSTTASMDRLSQGIAPSASGEKEGSGNGILMKMAPLVYWQVARGTDRETRHREYDELTTMTHDSEIARACTRLHGDTMHWLMEHPGATMKEFQHHALHMVQDEPNADPKGRIYRALAYPVGDFSKLVTRYASGQDGGKYGFFVPNTIAMTYDVFIASSGNYVDAVRYATNLGGDTDSIASIAGTMANAWSAGEFETPASFERVQEYDRLARLSRHFAQKALQLL